MPYNPNNVPNSPLPISMLPAASILKGTDLLLVTQVQSETEKKSRQVSLGNLLGSSLAHDSADKLIREGAGTIAISTHASPVRSRSYMNWNSSTQQRTELAELDLYRGTADKPTVYGSEAMFVLSFKVDNNGTTSRPLGHIIEPIAEVEITTASGTPVSQAKLEWSLGQQITHNNGSTSGSAVNFTSLGFSSVIPIGYHAYNVPLKAHLYLKFSPSTLTNIMAQEFKIKGLVHSAVSADNLVIK